MDKPRRIPQSRSDGTAYWKNLKQFGFMEEQVRWDHRSHDVLSGFLREQTENQRLSFLDCGVLSAVTIRKLRAERLNIEYTGIDISEAVIDDCRMRLPDVDWRVMDVRELDFADDGFDVVHIRHTLEHLPDYERAVREARRVARKWAIFCLFLPLAEEDCIQQQITPFGRMYFNRYGRRRFESLLVELFAGVEEHLIPGEERDNDLFICRI